MSVNEAVLLAVRFHPSIHNAQLDRVVDKFSVAVAKNAFMPYYNLSASSNWSKHNNVNISAGIKSKLGTNLSLHKTFGSDNAPIALELKQPLLRGFGQDVNLADLASAQDQYFSGKLALKSSLINVINHALSTYWELMRAQQDLKVQKDALELAKRTLKVYKIKVKVGQMAQFSVEQQKTALLNVQLALKNQELAVKVAQQNLNMALGLDPNIKINIVHDLSTLTKISLPTLQKSLVLAQQNNLDILQSQWALRGAKRSIVLAQDQQKWQLDAKGVLLKNDWEVGLDLDIPINDLARQEQLVQAKISYQKALNNLQRKKQFLVSDIRSKWYNCKSQLEQIKLSIKTVKAAKHDYESAKIRRMAGINSTFEVISLQQQWTDAQLQLSALKISYLNSLMDFYANLGITLDLWDLQLDSFGEDVND